METLSPRTFPFVQPGGLTGRQVNITGSIASPLSRIGPLRLGSPDGSLLEAR